MIYSLLLNLQKTIRQEMQSLTIIHPSISDISDVRTAFILPLIPINANQHKIKRLIAPRNRSAQSSPENMVHL
jgi:hypothetical protein